ncbi:hypothetical protein [Candidatus Macondimonas diazotrophica]|jgi:hypothetical protein|uniref:Uncharacterized protein n=1 Tax=Candidatus Macondimonas diazotrophica TaxID=2305248 RepID=A0A4Z0F4T5_9GAMM|nr:hypothetical protein [Candidatus Macondimonas diazotrophica]TFZ81299.1 hypothetical protein E4680_13105 [Candidatus Macondimonas diazotrophica]
MTDGQFQKLINKALKISDACRVIQAELSRAFEERYGATYSDIDADELIDAFDYLGLDNLSVAQVDEIMRKNGSPRLS